MSKKSREYLGRAREVVRSVEEQLDRLDTAADWFAETIAGGGMVHLFGTGHSRIMVEEMWPRYGSFPGFHPMVELSLTYHHPVVGSNGQRQAMFLENRKGLAAEILRNFVIDSNDSAMVISSSGCSLVSIEMAREFQTRRVRVVAMISRAHAEASESAHGQGKKLHDFADLVLDTGAPVGDAAVGIEGLETPVSPLSTLGGTLLINALKAEVAARLVERGHPPKVLTAASVIGRRASTEIFDAAYDEHARRLSKLFAFPADRESGGKKK